MRIARAELLDDLSATTCRSIELHDGYSTALKHVPDTLQERGELAKHQGLMPEWHDLIQAIRQVLNFYRPHVRIRLLDESRIER